MLAGLASVPVSAAAEEQTASQPAMGPVAEARARFNAGAQAFSEGRYKDAIDLFLDANRITPNVALSYNIGLAYEELGDAPNALRYYRDYLRRSPDAPDRSEVEGRVIGAEKRLNARGVQQVTILSVPEGATVSVDGRPLGVTPWTGELEPGSHSTSIQLRGYQDASRSFVLPADHAMDVAVDLAPRAMPTLRRSVDTSSAPHDRAPSGEGVMPTTWALLGVGVAGLGAAGGLELSRRGAEDDAEHSTTQVDAKQSWDRAKSLETAARVALGVGGAVTIVGGVLLYLDLRDDDSSRSAPLRAAGGCRSDGCDLVLDGAF